MLRPILLLILFINVCCQSAFTQYKTDKRLEAELRALTDTFHGVAGVYVRNLKTNKEAAIDADTIFPTASIVKVTILLGLMDKMNKGELQYDSSFTYKDSLLYTGSDILGSFKSDEKIMLKKLIMLMLTTSDNTASLWLQSIAGTGTRHESAARQRGFRHRGKSRPDHRRQQEHRTQHRADTGTSRCYPPDPVP